MPSPRWPSRSITMRSTTPSVPIPKFARVYRMLRSDRGTGPEQKLAIAVAARNRRWNNAGDRPSQRGNKAGDVLAHSRVHLRVAHDALLEVALAGFELRLDQRDH